MAPRRLLWVDPEPAPLAPARTLLRARGCVLRTVPGAEEALPLLETWHPQLLLLAYTLPPGAMPYETFVHVALPPCDPYRPGGPLHTNPWGHTALPLLLVCDGPPLTIPGFAVPHLARAAHFLPKPCDPALLLHAVLALLPDPGPELVLDLRRQCLLRHGLPCPLPPRALDLLHALAHHWPRPRSAAQLARWLQRTRGLETRAGTVRSTVRLLRTRLEADPAQPHLLCRGPRGYVLARKPGLIPAEPESPDGP